MPFSGYNDLISKMTSGQTREESWFKQWGASAAVAGRFYDLFQFAGSPVAGAYSGTALNAQIPTQATTGALWHGGDVAALTKHLVTAMANSAAATFVPGLLTLVDLCMYYPGINANLATSQTLVNGAALTRYTSGDGLVAWPTVTTALGATASNLSMSYTDHAGNAGNSLGMVVPATASQIVAGLVNATVGPFLPLAAGDRGLRSVQSVQMSAAMGAGAFALCVGKRLLDIPIGVAGYAAERDLVNQLPSLEQVVDGACPVWLFQAGAAVAATSLVHGKVRFAWG